MKRTIFDLLGNHPVYLSPRLVLGSVAAKFGMAYSLFPRSHSNSFVLTIPPGTYLFYTRFKQNKNNINVLLSPLICINSWEAWSFQMPFIIFEEYYSRNNLLDILAKFLLFPFRHNLFVAQTKRSRIFLEDSRITSFFVPPAEKRRLGKKERKHILFVGKLLSSKNPHLFLALAKAFPKEKFIMVGKGEMLKQLRESAKSLKNLEIIPYVESREKLFEYYANAKLLIHPAFKDPIGHVIIEALSTQTPVLASSGAGASDFLPKEWVLDPNDQNAWIEKIKYILSHQEESIKKAEETFEKEHLNIDDPYFEKVADELAAHIMKRWPNLAKKP